MIEDTETDDALGHDRENEVLGALDNLLRVLMRNKPGDCSELDKVYAVALTDTQKVYSWFSMYAYGGLPEYFD